MYRSLKVLTHAFFGGGEAFVKVMPWCLALRVLYARWGVQGELAG